MVDHVVIGSLNADFLFKVHQMPQIGETVRSYQFQPMLGGKGGNQAAAIARLGGSVAMVGRVGNDIFGPRSIENLETQGVDVSHITTDKEAPTGTAVGLVSDSGQNIIVISAGANSTVSKQDVDAAGDLLSRARFLLLQCEIPMDTILYAIDKAHSYSVKVIFNPAPAYPLPWDCLAKVDYLIPNESEASILAGMEIRDLPSAESAALKFTDCGVPVLIMTLGEKGALLATAEGISYFPAIVVDTVDPTACGDAFVGGFAVALAKGYEIDKAILYANCAGAVAVTRFGAQPSLPYAREVQELFDRQ
jgi:ribokinase